MSSLLDLIGSQISSEHLSALSEQIGATPEQTEKAVGAAFPTMIGALARNAADEPGQQRLHQAIERDHDGSILDSLGSLIGGGGRHPHASSPTQSPGITTKTTAGPQILDHILGGKRGRVESGVSRASGLSGGQSSKLMGMLAPILMGAVGKQQRSRGLSPGGLGDLLRGESKQVESQASAQGGSFIGRMLDQDGDGDFDMMDVVKFGMGRLFGRGR